MAAHAHDHAHDADHAAHGEHTHHPNYWKIYWILLALLGVSVAGPFLEVRVITLITAFGVAIVKAYLVARNFMHINVAAKYVAYLMVTMLVFMLLLFAGTAGDVMNARGRNWDKPSWLEQRAIPEPASTGGHGGEAAGHGEGSH
jgi:caa(3)-type oxidase subunit IV